MARVRGSFRVRFMVNARARFSVRTSSHHCYLMDDEGASQVALVVRNPPT